MLDMIDEDMGEGSYLLTQGNTSAPPRKRGKSKSGSDGGERRRKKAAGGGGAQMTRGLGPQDYGMDIPGGSGVSSSGGLAETGMDSQDGRTPKLVFKKGGRKGMDKGPTSMDEAHQASGLHEQKPGTLDMSGPGSMDSIGLLQTSSGPKQGGTSSNYDDAMQFLKKRRYLNAANSGGAGADFSSVHLPQPTVIQGGIGEPTLALLDTSPLVSVDKHDKSGIPDEVLQSLLDHYTHKSDVTFDLQDSHHVELQPASATPEMVQDDGSPSGDKSGVMNEYSKFLLQTLERTSHSSFILGPSGPFPNLLSSSSSPASTLFTDKNIYTASPLDCGFGQPVSSPLAPSSSSLTKSHYGMLVGSPSPSHASPSSQQGFHLSNLEAATHQQLTPSQELTDQLEKQHSPQYPLTSQELTNGVNQKDQQTKNGTSSANGNGSSSNGSVYSMAQPPDLTTLETSKEVDMRTTYQIENFAQAFGSQFKSGRRTPLGYGGEVDHRIQRTPVSEFSGYTSLLADVSEPASSGSKTPTSQSYR